LAIKIWSELLVEPLALAHLEYASVKNLSEAKAMATQPHWY